MSNIKIPIKNIYQILCYAWNIIDYKDNNVCGNEEFDSIYNLLGRILVKEVTKLCKRGFYKEYIDIQDKDFKSIQNTVINNKLGTALIELCSCFPSIEEILNRYIDKCSKLKHENSEFSTNLTIIKPLFSELGKLNTYFESK